MSFIADLFGKKSPRPDLELAGLVAWFKDEAAPLEQRHVDRELLCAQLADRYRDVSIEPIDPAAFEELTQDLVPEAWRRLALATGAMELEEVKNALCELHGGDPTVQVRDGFVDVARTLDLSTMEVLRGSPARVEEFARHWIIKLGGRVLGETDKESSERLERLDYRRLLNEAERAKNARARSEDKKQERMK